MEVTASPVRSARSTNDNPCGRLVSPSETEVYCSLDQQLISAMAAASSLSSKCQETKEAFVSYDLLSASQALVLENMAHSLPGLPSKPSDLPSDSNEISNILQSTSLNLTLIHNQIALLQTYSSFYPLPIDSKLEEVGQQISAVLCGIEAATTVLAETMSEDEKVIDDELMLIVFGQFEEELYELESQNDLPRLTTKKISKRGYVTLKAIQQIMTNFITVLQAQLPTGRA